MSLNRYIGYTKTELLTRLRQVNDAIDRGSLTAGGLQPGVKHEFAAKSDAELRAIVRELQSALFVIDPDNYANPATDRPGITEPVFF